MPDSSNATTALDFMNVRELAALLRVSATTVYRLAEKREIPFHRLSKELRFQRADVEEYVRRHRVEAIGPSTYERLQKS